MLIFGTVEGYRALTTTFSNTGDKGFMINWDNNFQKFFDCIWNDIKLDIEYLVNFNSLVENVPRLDALNPYWNGSMNNTTLFVNEIEFDNWYVNLITTNPQAFRQIVDIMRAVYNGKTVFILCDWSTEIGVNMIEALIKFITDSYGYRCNIVNNPEDICVKEGKFSSKGIQLLDANMETYIKMFGTRGLPSDPE